MRWSDERENDARNVLLDAALEFGKNWRRDVRVLAGERLPGLDEGVRSALAEEVVATRAAIERLILVRWDAAGGTWSGADSDAAQRFVRTAYPWMEERNIESPRVSWRVVIS